jgi:hypothetical protein
MIGQFGSVSPLLMWFSANAIMGGRHVKIIHQKSRWHRDPADNDSGLPIHREEQFCAGLVGVPGLPGPPKGRYMGYSYSKPQKDAEQLETGNDGGRHHQTTMMLDILFGIFFGVAMSNGTCSLDRHDRMYVAQWVQRLMKGQLASRLGAMENLVELAATGKDVSRCSLGRCKQVDWS